MDERKLDYKRDWIIKGSIHGFDISHMPFCYASAFQILISRDRPFKGAGAYSLGLWGSGTDSADRETAIPGCSNGSPIYLRESMCGLSNISLSVIVSDNLISTLALRLLCFPTVDTFDNRCQQAATPVYSSRRHLCRV